MRNFTFLLLVLQGFLVCATAQQVPDLQRGLIAYFPLNGTINDVTDNHHGGNASGIEPASDRFSNQNSAYSLNIKASISYTDLNIPSEATTVALWVKVTKCGQRRAFISKYDYNQNIEVFIGHENCRYIAKWNIGGTYFKLTDDKGLFIIDPLNPKFEFICLTYDGQKAVLYVNGVEVSSKAISGAIIRNDLPMIIGNDGNGGYGDLVASQETIDDLRFYNRALNDEEIQALSKDSIITVAQVECCGFFITQTTVYAEPKVILNGNDRILETGITWGTTSNFDSTKNRIPVDSTRNRYMNRPSSIITGLSTNTNYYIKGYAVNSAGIAYSRESTFTTSGNLDLQKDLIAYYPFNGNSNDESGNGHHGTLNGTNGATDRFYNTNQALAFTGLRNTLSFKSLQFHSPASSISCWIKPTEKKNDTIFINTIPNSLTMLLRLVNHHYMLELTVGFQTITLFDEYGYTNADPDRPRFDFLALTMGENAVSFYINNALLSQKYVDRDMIFGFPKTVNQDPEFSFRGIVDDLRVYSRELQWEEIDSLQRDRPPSVPVITADWINSIDQNSASVHSSINFDANLDVLETGVCWSTSPNPDISDHKITGCCGLADIISKITGLDPNTTYYMRAFAKNNIGIGYSNELTFKTFPASTFSAVTDIDGNTYKTVKIGTQTWMAENLKTTKYADGTPITSGINIYKNDLNNKSIYGLLYTWYAATNAAECKLHSEKIQGVCPDGWHIPSFGEQSALIEYLGGHAIAGGKLKEVGYEHWNEPNGSATNETGFSAFGAGSNYFVNWNMVDTFLKTGTLFWNTACEEGFEFNHAYGLGLNNQTGKAGLGHDLSSNGSSVRCIKDTSLSYERIPVLSTDTIMNITHDFAAVKGSVIIYGSSPLLYGGVCWDTVPHPDTTDFKTVEKGNWPLYRNNVLTRLKPNTTYYVRTYAVNTTGVGYGNEHSFTTKPDLIIRGTVTDIEDNIYKTVRIGNQNWMAENLKTTKLNDGTPIPLVLSDLNGSEWLRFNEPAYSFLFDKINNLEIYGASYNFKTVLTNKICPTGWHVPSNEEWNELNIYLDSAVGSKLKEAGYEHWRRYYYNMDANNSSGFTALPGGVRMNYGRFYDYVGGWWANSNSEYWYVSYNAESLGHWQDVTGASIRCLEGTEDSTESIKNDSTVYGDINFNNLIQPADASLALQYSVGLDPLPSIDPLPWEDARIAAADVDNINGITAFDASLILQYEAGLIKSFPAEDSKKSFSSPQADIDVSLENGYVTFRPKGELYGFNLKITGSSDVLGVPQILNPQVLSAFNITPGSYSVGVAAVVAPKEKDVFMKIPVKEISNEQVTIEMTINNVTQHFILGSPTTISESAQNSVEIFPNPANTVLYFRNLSEKAFITIYNLKGDAVIRKHVDNGQIDVSSLTDGAYFIKIKDKKNTVMRKFVKQELMK